MNRLLVTLAITLTSLACSEVGPTNPFDPQAPKTVQALGTISGRVANAEDGTAVEEARILLYRSDRLPPAFCTLNDGPPPMNGDGPPPMNDGGVRGDGELALAEATTNEEGLFQLNDLSRGDYTLCVTHRKFLPLRRGELNVGIGAELALGEDLLVTPGKGTIIAQVDLGDLEIGSDQGQAVIQGVNVTLTPIGEGLGNSSDGTPDGAGAVTFSRIPLGSWRLRFSHPDYRPVVEDIELENIGQTIEVRGLLPIELEVNPGTISGVLVLEEPSATSMDGIELTLTDNDEMATNVNINLVTNPEMADYGRFTIDGDELRAGFYRLNITHSGSEYRPTNIAPVHVRAGQETDLGNVEIAYARGSVSGNVLTVDSQSAAGAIVTLTGLTEAITQTDAAGAYGFDNVRGGAYSISISLNGYRSATVEDQVVSQDQETVIADTVLEINPGSLAGRVIDEAGDPIAGVSAGIEGSVAAQTAEDGTFSLPGLRSGVYTIGVRKAGYVTETILNQAVNPGQVTDLGTFQLAHARNRLSGIIQIEDGAPGSGAIVRLGSGPTAASAVTGSDGTFSFDSVIVGDYSITISLDGYQTETIHGITVADEQAGDAGTIVLQINPGSFSGTVISEDGSAIAGASVAVSGGAVNTTDENGAFVIEGLRAGDYSLVISAANHDSEDLISLAIRAGANTDLGAIALDFARNDLSGSVATEDDQSAAGAIVTLSGGPDEGSVVVDADGGFSFTDLRVGTYTVTVTLEGYQTATAAGVMVTADSAGDAGVINLTINPGSFIGAITDEEGVAIAGATVAVSGGANTNTGEDGRFSISGLRAGDYTLTLSADDHDGEVLRNQAIIAGGENDLGVISLSFARNALTGTISTEDNASVSGALVTLSEGPTEASAVVDAAGAFRFENVRVGTYTVTANLDGYQSNTAIAIVSQAQAGDAGVINLSIDPGSISGTLVDEAGAPINGATITPAGGNSTTSAADGTFALQGLRAGDYTLSISAEDYDIEPRSPVAVQAGQDTALGSITVPWARSELSGTVTTDDGSSSAGAIASLSSEGLTAGSAVVDAEGYFTFENVRAGEYTVTVTLDAYQPATAAGVRVGLDEPGDAGIIELSINPGSISGEIVDEEGDEVIGATVSITGGGNTISGDEGSFTLNGLKAGEYTLTFTADGHDSLVLRNLSVNGGEDTHLDEVEIYFARNQITGSVTTEDAFNPAGADVTLSGGRTSSAAVVDANGNFTFEDVIVDTYTVTVSLDDYEDDSRVVDVRADQPGDTGNIELQIQSGSLSGKVMDEQGSPLEFADVIIVGGAATTTDADGEFIFSQLRAGTYSLNISKDGYVSENLNNQAVEADEATEVGDITLEYERGSLTGTVSLNGDGDLSTVTVVASANFSDLTRVAILNRDGSWAIEDLRAGQYTVEASATDYVAASDTAEVVFDQETQVNLNLEIDYGCRIGQIDLSDGGSDYASVELTLADSGEALNAANEAGEFTIVALPPGRYTVRGSLDGYDDGEADIIVHAGGGCDDEPKFVLSLRDVTAPHAPVLVLQNPQWQALPDQDDGITYVPVGRYSPLTMQPAADGALFGFTLELDRTNSDPLSDVNFFNVDPPPQGDHLLGLWRLTLGDIRMDLAADSFSLDRCLDRGEVTKECVHLEYIANQGRYLFTFITGTADGRFADFPATNRIQTILLQAIDERVHPREGNESEPGQFQFLLDTSAPMPTGEGAPLQLRVSGTEVKPADPERGMPYETYYTNDEVISLEVTTSVTDAAFGCTYLYSFAMADGALDPPQESAEWANTCLYWDEDNPNLDGLCVNGEGATPSLLDTEECYSSGRPRLSITPDALETLYCVRAVDRSGQMSNAGCVVVIQDKTSPLGFDAYPNDVNVRGPSALIYLTNDLSDHALSLGQTLDDNFSHFEVRSNAAGAEFSTVQDCADEGCTQIRVALEAGRTNIFEFVAVDEAGNRSEAVEVTLHETSNVGIAESAGAVGTSPTLYGTNIAWAEPRGCEPVGPDGDFYGRSCQFEIQYLDRSLPTNTVRSLDFVPQYQLDEVNDAGSYQPSGNAGPNSCVVACEGIPEGFQGSKAPLVRMTSSGMYATTYLEGKAFGSAPPEHKAKTHRLIYQGFGGDGVPTLAANEDDCTVQIVDNNEDWPIIALETNEQVLAYVRHKGFGAKPYRLYMRPQFKATAEDEDACDAGKREAWTYVDLTHAPVQLGVIEDAVFVVSSGNDVMVYTQQGSERPISFEMKLKNATSFLSAAPANAQVNIVAGAFSNDSLRLVASWEEGAAGEERTVHKLYTFNMQSGVSCNEECGRQRQNQQAQGTEECFNAHCPDGVHQRVFSLVKGQVRDHQCDCPEGWGCFEGNRIEAAAETVSDSVCVLAEWGHGDEPNQEQPCAEDADCGDAERCIYRPLDERGLNWNHYCASVCNDDGECPDGGQCLVNTSNALSAQIVSEPPNNNVPSTFHVCMEVSEGIEFTPQLDEDCDWCGQVDQLSIDGETMAWTTKTLINGSYRYGLNAARLPADHRQQILPRTLVAPTASPIVAIEASGERVIYLDSSSGTSRVRQAEVSQQNWTALSPTELYPKVNLAAGNTRLLYASYDTDVSNSRDSDGLYSISIDVDAPSAPVELNLADENCNLIGESMQREWRSGKGIDVDGNLAVIYARTECGDIFNDSAFIADFLVGPGVPPTWTEISLDEGDVPAPHATPGDWEPALQPAAHLVGNDQHQVETTVSVSNQGAIVYNRPTMEPGGLAEPCDVAVGEDGRAVRDGFGLRLRVPLRPGVFEYPRNKSFLMSELDLIQSNQSHPNSNVGYTDCAALDMTHNSTTNETHIICAGYPAGCPSNPAEVVNKASRAKQRLIYYQLANKGATYSVVQRADLTAVVNPVKLDRNDDPDCDDSNLNDYSGLDFESCGALKAVSMGSVVDAVVNADGVVAIEVQDDDIRHVVSIDPGADGRWGYSVDLEGDVTNDDSVRLIYTRLGDNLGGLTINRSALIFADARKTRQTELLRVSLADYGVQRITDNDRTQAHPSANDSGLVFVDDRYSVTANGIDIVSDALTRQQLKSSCDTQYNQCPVGFVCSNALGSPSCFTAASAECDDAGACGRGGVCFEFAAQFCLGTDEPCQVCLDESAANDRCADHPFIPEELIGCFDSTGCNTFESELGDRVICSKELLLQQFEELDQEARQMIAGDGCGICSTLINPEGPGGGGNDGRP